MNLKNLYQKIKRRILSILIWARKVTLPGFDRIPLYDVMLLFFRSVSSTDKSIITTRASAVSYSIFIAVLPTLLFVITLIPYIPIDNFQLELLQLIRNVIPSSIYDIVNDTLTEVILKPHGDLLSFSFIAGVILASNGIVAMMNAFDASSLVDEHRPWYLQRLVAIRLLFILALLLTVAVALVTNGQRLINYLDKLGIILTQFTYYLLSFMNWVIIVALFFFAYSSLFYYAPSKKTRYRFISAGSTMSTVLSIIILSGFNFYINNFSRYNKLYGSIGTIFVIMLLFYLLSFAILFGFELNASIATARNSGRRRLLKHKAVKRK
ncbi:MAG: YihY/virulence factor BrkB family protein [Mangrovibacterium sp.]